MSRFAKDLAVLALAVSGVEDHSAKKGFLVKLSSGAAALNDSATVPAFGVILDGEKAGGMDSVGVLGGNLGTVKLKLGGTVAQGDRLMQKNDGTSVVEVTTAARVVHGIALEAGVVDELIEAIVFTPIINGQFQIYNPDQDKFFTIIIRGAPDAEVIEIVAGDEA